MKKIPTEVIHPNISHLPGLLLLVVLAVHSDGGFFMTNDRFFLFPILSYGNKNTMGAVARLFFSDPPFAPHASERGKNWKSKAEQ